MLQLTEIMLLNLLPVSVLHVLENLENEPLDLENLENEMFFFKYS